MEMGGNMEQFVSAGCEWMYGRLGAVYHTYTTLPTAELPPLSPPHPHHLVEITLALTFPGGESSEIIEWAPYEGSVEHIS